MTKTIFKAVCRKGVFGKVRVKFLRTCDHNQLQLEVALNSKAS